MSVKNEKYIINLLSDLSVSHIVYKPCKCLLAHIKILLVAAVVIILGNSQMVSSRINSKRVLVSCDVKHLQKKSN